MDCMPGSKWCDGDNARNYMNYLYGSSGATMLESVDPYIGAPGKCPATSNLTQQPAQKFKILDYSSADNQND